MLVNLGQHTTVINGHLRVPAWGQLQWSSSKDTALQVVTHTCAAVQVVSPIAVAAALFQSDILADNLVASVNGTIAAPVVSPFISDSDPQATSASDRARDSAMLADGVAQTLNVSTSAQVAVKQSIVALAQAPATEGAVESIVASVVDAPAASQAIAVAQAIGWSCLSAHASPSMQICLERLQ